MALQTKDLERIFRYNSVELADPGAMMSVNEVRDLYANTYPEIVNAAIEGPDEKDGKLVYTFRRAVGRKGNDARRPALTKLREDHATVPQLLALSKLDSDPVSFFTDGTSWADANAAFVIIKGGKLAREVFELFERQGLVTPGKAVVDLPADLADLKADETILVVDLHPLASAGVTLIAHERKRQVELEGYTPEHDDGHTDHSIAMAAAAYAAPEQIFYYDAPHDWYRDCWPWLDLEDRRKVVPVAPAAGPGVRMAKADDYTLDERIRMLSKAGALMAAEIDRLTRLQKKPEPKLDPATAWPFPSSSKP